MTIAKDFRDPPAEYRCAPFWFWNHELKLEELERQILELKAGGCGGFIMHARHGLLTPYLGREWMEAVEHCARLADREGLWAWLYDEDNWPSGTVGMRLAREHPEYRMSQILITDQADLKKGELIDRQLAVGDEMYCVLAIPFKDAEAVFGEENDITRRVKDGRLKYTAAVQGEKVVVFSRCWFPVHFFGGYLDTLNKEACAWFVAETHQKYAARLKRWLGKSLKGIFTDEPSSWYSACNRSIQFTDELPKRFQKEHKMPLARALPALFFPAGPLTSKVRAAFLETVKQMYCEAFFKPIADWCQKHKMRFIGHVNAEGELADQVKHQGDYFATAACMSYAGTDTLFESTFHQELMSNNHIATKLASSAEHLLEKERTMAEAFGVAAGWELTLPTLKWLGDFQAACGVNYFMPHAAYYSISGFRKWECPPDEFYHASYWPFYKVFADHVARLSLVLHGGEHIAPVALLVPLATMAATLNPAPEHWWRARPIDNPPAEALESAFEDTAEGLARHQLDFDLLNEEILARGTVAKDGQLEIAGPSGKVRERFRALVLPHVSVLSRKTLGLLEAWAQAGLVIVFVETLPEESPEEGRDDDLAARCRRLLELPNVCRAGLADAAFVREIKCRIASDVDVGDARDLVYLMKDKDDQRFVFLVNTNRERGYEGLKVRLRAGGVPHLMDTRSGEIRHLAPAAQGPEWTELDLDFPPAGSHLLMFAKRRAAEEAAPPRLAPVEGAHLALGDTWQFTAEGGNYFPLKRWQLEIAGHARPENKWSYFTKTYRTEFHAAVSPARALLLADGLFDQKWPLNNLRAEPKISINGQEITHWQEGTHYDRLVLEADVTDLIRQGANEVTITAASQYIPGLNLDQALYLAGDFTVAGRGDHEVLSVSRGLIRTGSWAQQGFPYFSGIGRYEQEFDLPDSLAGERLFLEFDKVAHVVEVRVNDEVAGLLPWHPYSLEVTRFVRPGKNHLSLRVANSMANVFLLRPDESGLVGKVTLVAKEPAKG